MKEIRQVKQWETKEIWKQNDISCKMNRMQIRLCYIHMVSTKQNSIDLVRHKKNSFFFFFLKIRFLWGLHQRNRSWCFVSIFSMSSNVYLEKWKKLQVLNITSNILKHVFIIIITLWFYFIWHGSASSPKQILCNNVTFQKHHGNCCQMS